MPPWYVEKNIGIQKFKNDPSLSDDEIAKIAKWADSGAPRGNAADMPPAREWSDGIEVGDRHARPGRQDARTSSSRATAPDWWGEIPRVPTGLTEDRYVSALEVKRSQRRAGAAGTGRETVGGRFVFHHMIWSTRVLDDDGRHRSIRVGGRRRQHVGGRCTRSAATPISSTRSRRGC